MMKIETEDARTRFRPGEALRGAASWELPDEPRSLELRLLWYTAGIGTRDVGVVARLAFERPAASDRRDFALTLPEGPYSFSGKLISLVWALELVAADPDEVTRLELTVSPTGREVLLYPEEEASPDEAAG